MRKTDSNHAAASVGRCPPDPLGFFAWALETAGACRAGQNQLGPLFTALQAAPKPGHRGIRSWTVADVEPTSTRGPHIRASAVVSFCLHRLLLLTTNCLLLLTRMSPFARTTTRYSRPVSRSFQKETNPGFVVSKRRQGHLGKFEKRMMGWVLGSGLLARTEWWPEGW